MCSEQVNSKQALASHMTTLELSWVIIESASRVDRGKDECRDEGGIRVGLIVMQQAGARMLQ